MLSTGKVIALLVLAAAVPATADSFVFSIHAPERPVCVSIGTATYRISDTATQPDYRVRLADDAADLRIQLVDQADEADFVLVDDPEAPSRCDTSGAVRTVTIGRNVAAPDITVALTQDAAAADYRVFAHSERLPGETIAALFAVTRKNNALAAR